MDALHHPTVTIRHAAAATGFAPKALRMALAGTDFPLIGQARRNGPEWRRFAVVDVVRLAVMYHLAHHGVPLAAATQIVTDHVDNRLFALVTCGVGIPPFFLRTRLLGLALHVSRRADGTYAARTAPLGTPPDRGPATLIINLGQIAAETVDRLESAEGTNL